MLKAPSFDPSLEPSREKRLRTPKPQPANSMAQDPSKPQHPHPNRIRIETAAHEHPQHTLCHPDFSRAQLGPTCHAINNSEGIRQITMEPELTTEAEWSERKIVFRLQVRLVEHVGLFFLLRLFHGFPRTHLTFIPEGDLRSSPWRHQRRHRQALGTSRTLPDSPSTWVLGI